VDERRTKESDGERGGNDSEKETNKQGFGATARSTLDTRKLDPSGIVVFHQADVGEFLRDEDTMF
jgi:ribosome biogenesis protein Nip4